MTVFLKVKKINLLLNKALWIHKNKRWSFYHSMRNKILHKHNQDNCQMVAVFSP
jgi:hypothetical protein